MYLYAFETDFIIFLLGNNNNIKRKSAEVIRISCVFYKNKTIKLEVLSCVDRSKTTKNMWVTRTTATNKHSTTILLNRQNAYLEFSKSF